MSNKINLCSNLEVGDVCYIQVDLEFQKSNLMPKINLFGKQCVVVRNTNMIDFKKGEVLIAVTGGFFSLMLGSNELLSTKDVNFNNKYKLIQEKIQTTKNENQLILKSFINENFNKIKKLTKTFSNLVDEDNLENYLKNYEILYEIKTATLILKDIMKIQNGEKYV